MQSNVSSGSSAGPSEASLQPLHQQLMTSSMKALCFDDASMATESGPTVAVSASAARRAAALAAALSGTTTGTSTRSASTAAPASLRGRAHMMHHLIVSVRKALHFEEVEDSSGTPAAPRLSLGSSTPAAAASGRGSRFSLGSSTSTGYSTTPKTGRELLFDISREHSLEEAEDLGSGEADAVRAQVPFCRLLQAHLEAEVEEAEESAHLAP